MQTQETTTTAPSPKPLTERQFKINLNAIQARLNELITYQRTRLTAKGIVQDECAKIQKLASETLSGVACRCTHSHFTVR